MNPLPYNLNLFLVGLTKLSATHTLAAPPAQRWEPPAEGGLGAGGDHRYFYEGDSCDSSAPDPIKTIMNRCCHNLTEPLYRFYFYQDGSRPACSVNERRGSDLHLFMRAGDIAARPTLAYHHQCVADIPER